MMDCINKYDWNIIQCALYATICLPVKLVVIGEHMTNPYFHSWVLRKCEVDFWSEAEQNAGVTKIKDDIFQHIL